jgi:histidine triad (HIT) family protein
MPPPPSPCSACDIVAGRRRPPGGVLARSRGFLLHALDGPTPVRGWLVLTAARHVHGLYDLDGAEAAALGALAARVQRAQRSALGAEHAYAALFAEAVPHLHLHLVPRFSDAPPRLVGARVFLATAEEAIPEADAIEAARAVARALKR